MPIEHEGRIYQAGEISEPIERSIGTGWGNRKVTQTLVGKTKGGRIDTVVYVSFTHQPLKNFYRRYSQRLRAGKTFTLTDKSKAIGI